MKKLITIKVCFMLCMMSLLQAEEKGALPLQDQLKLIRKIEFGKLDTGIGETFTVPFSFPFRNCQAIGSLVIEVDDLKLDTCLQAVQEKIREGYDPNYPGDFDNSFLNELMIGIIDHPLDHARRKIGFRLRVPVGNNEDSLPKDILQTRNVLVCDVGLSLNHRYVALNFWQEFLNIEDVSSCFFLLDHLGEILWHQETEPIIDPEWEGYLKQAEQVKAYNSQNSKSNSGRWRGIPWYPGAIKAKEPVQSFFVSNEGHVLTMIGQFGIWLVDSRIFPNIFTLRDKEGKTLFSKTEAYNCGAFEFSEDASKLRYIINPESIKNKEMICIDIKTGETIPSNGYCFQNSDKESNYVINRSYSISKQTDTLIKVDSRISIMDEIKNEVAATIIPITIQKKPDQKIDQNIKTNMYLGNSIIDKKAGRFFIVSPIAFLDFEFLPLAHD